MADSVAETKETTPVSTPEKKVHSVTEDSEVTENGNAEKPSENGTEEVNGIADETETAVENGDSTDSTTITAKRKSAGGDAPEDSPTEGASPEKKAKLDEKASDEATNGESEVAA